MKRNAQAGLGAFHPILFFVIVYAISLFLAFFVCSTVYYALNDEAPTTAETMMAQSGTPLHAGATATAFR